MIRRDESNAPDASARWTLISQVDHARLAGQLARHWRDQTFAPPEVMAEILAAIDHHDDGWLAWDRALAVDEASRPRTFTELTLDETLPIWDASITKVEPLGSLAVWLVAGHFVALLKASDRQTSGPGQAWLARIDRLQADRLTAWQTGDRTLEQATYGLRLLQMFDAMSLWLCCREFPDTWIRTAPDGSELRWSMIDPKTATVAPWPFSEPEFTVSTPAAQVLRSACTGDQRPLVADGQQRALHWRIMPGDV